MNRDDFLQYLNTLSRPMGAIFQMAEQIAKETEDTLTEEFQLAAGIEEMFWRRARRWKEDRE